MERVEFSRGYTIKKIICQGYIIKLSDFEYTANDGKKYLMYVSKGHYGAWHVVKSLIDNKLYAVDNLWSSSREKNIERNAVVIASDISYNTLLKKFGDKELNYVNTLDYVNEEDLDQIKNDCEKSIKKHIKENYIRENTKYYLKISNDSGNHWSHLYKKPLNIDTKKIEYFFHIRNEYGDFEDRFETFDEALEECVNSINRHNKKFIEKCKYFYGEYINCINDDNDYISDDKNKKFADNLISTKVVNINDEIVDQLKKYNINFYQIITKNINSVFGDYNYSLTIAYLLSDEDYNSLKDRGVKLTKYNVSN